jgi:general secretion pathway protein H
MFEAGIESVPAGVTTVEELLRSIRPMPDASARAQLFKAQSPIERARGLMRTPSRGISGKDVQRGPETAETEAIKERQHGFTLLEVLVVLLILGMALGLVLTRGPPRTSGFQARAAVRDLAQDLRLARVRAIALDRPVGLTLDAPAHRWRIDGGPLRMLPPSLDIAMLTVAGLTRDPGAGRIVFMPDGSSSGGKIRLGGTNFRAIISADWLTGRVAVAGGD